MPTDPMDHDPQQSDLQQLWQSQPTEHDPMTLAQIHERAERLQTRVRRRNVREYLAGAFVLVAFAPIAVRSHSWMMQLGAALTIAATAFVIWYIRRNGAAIAPIPSAETEGAALVEFHRRELIRQRALLHSIGAWYLAPFVPGLTLILMGRWFQAPAAHRAAATDHLFIAVTGVIMVLVMGGIWLLNRRGARRVQRMIDEM